MDKLYKFSVDAIINCQFTASQIALLLDSVAKGWKLSDAYDCDVYLLDLETLNDSGMLSYWGLKYYSVRLTQLGAFVQEQLREEGWYLG